MSDKDKIQFKDTFSYIVIYLITIEDEKHKGLIKIGQTKLNTNISTDKLAPNCSELNKAAKRRIKEYTNTAGIEAKLLHTELAIKREKDKDGNIIIKPFSDKDVHRVLENSNIKRAKLDGSTGNEWFRIEKETALEAIQAVKENYENLSHSEVKGNTPIIFRPEQKDAIELAKRVFKKNDAVLWNAKMRFGKTLSALQVVKDCKFKKTIILTHRPVVNEGWYEDFNKIFNGTNYIYGSKTNGYSVGELNKKDNNFVYFASIQDLRGSEIVGGKFRKNKDIFDTVWDFVIVDEAHEGTKTTLGDETVKAIVKPELKKTKALSLSGTPFNIMDEYDSNSIYTWDYIMEQESKYLWDKEHFGDSNPYEELPELNIYTYDLGDLLNNNYVELEDKAFNFHEFFRTWTGDYSIDYAQMPEEAKIGDFVHEKDIISFLNLMTKEDKNSDYPYSKEEYRNLFKHSLWMVPGVKEARALKNLMLKHHVFGCGQFEIVNVAGNNDEESNDALNSVKKAIKRAEKNGTYTITLSCGKLTTGVTVKEWTAVFMLAGSYSTSAANYLQTIFRVQSPCKKDGKIKSSAYVFDFAPDRTLKMVSEAVSVSRKAGKTKSGDRDILGKFLNYCPVISIQGSQMKEYKVDRMLQQLKKAYAEKVVRNGFDDTNLYNDELLKLNELDIEKFDKLKGIVGKSNPSKKINDININDQGLTKEEYEEEEDLNKKKKKKKLTEEERARLEELKKKRKVRNDAISILRGISIRMPLLIYGADLEYNEEITLDKFVENIDDNSWNEFMPIGVTKEIFQEFKKYYDEDVFVAAGRRIRNISKEADSLNPTERVKKIASLFSNFKNPDKETVLTPWRVVNMHMSDVLGGYNFWNEKFEDTLDEPIFVDRGKVTKETFANPDAQILEINSKTGLYPLYVAYSIYKAKCKKYNESELNINIDLQNELWKETIENNIFVICKTPMARQITSRTLRGYEKLIKVNTHYIEDLVEKLKNKPQQFVERVLRPSYWGKGDIGKMKFDAIVGNPPYQEMDGGAQASSKPIYQHFVSTSKMLNPKYISFIMPTRWYAGGKGLDNFRDDMLNDKHIEKLYDCINPEEIFPNTNIRGGVCYFLWNNNYDNTTNKMQVITIEQGKEPILIKRDLKVDGVDIFIRHGYSISIIEKISKYTNLYLDKYISSRRPFGIDGNIVKKDDFKSEKFYDSIKCFGKGKTYGYISKNMINKNVEFINVWKVFTPRANNIGTELNDDNLNAFIGEPNTICTESYIMIGAELCLNESSCKNLIKYLKTKFARFTHSIAKASQDATAKTYRFVPLEDFNDKSDIDWSKSISEIDKQLYSKYNLTEDEIKFIEEKIKEMN